METLRAAVIGCGVIGPVHAEGYRSLPGVHLAAVCDVVPERARELAERAGADRWTDTLDAILAAPDIDVVSICTGHAAHADMVVAALAAGKHVLCEKPLGASLADLAAMAAAGAQRPDRVFGGVFQHRFDPWAVALREQVGVGGFGTLLTVSGRLHCQRPTEYYATSPWRGRWNGEGGSTLINQAIHFIDLLTWTTAPAASVTAEWTNRAHEGLIETEDTAMLSLRLRNGALAGFEATSASFQNWTWRLVVNGTAGSVEIADDRVVAARFADDRLRVDWETRLEAAVEAAEDAHRAVMSGKTYYGTGHGAQLADFIASVRDPERPLRTSAASAAATVRVVLGAYESGREGRRVVLP